MYQFVRTRYVLLIDHSQDTVDLVSTGRKSLVLTKASLSILISRSREVETIDSMIIILFPSSTSLSNESMVNQNYFENEDLVSSRLLRSINGILGSYVCILYYIMSVYYITLCLYIILHYVCILYYIMSVYYITL